MALLGRRILMSGWIAAAPLFLLAMQSENCEDSLGLYRRRDYAGAVRSVQTHLTREGAGSRCFQIYGLALARMQQYAEAEQQLARAIALNPSDGSIHYDLGFILSEQKKYDEAVPPLETAVRLQPRNLQAHFLLGLCYISKDRKKPIANFSGLALDQFAIVASAKPDYPLVHQMIARIYSTDGDMDRALAEFAVELKLDPKNGQARAELAEALLKLGRVEQALEELRKAQADAPQLSLIPYLMAKCHRAADRAEEAIRSLQKAVAIDAEFADAHYLMARLYEETGQPQLAAKHMLIFRQLKQQGR
jgi:tetratricopeptide (TPR) repeat protein